MTWWKRTFGVDLFDTLVHIGITFGIVVVMSDHVRQPEPFAIVAIASTILYSVRRRIALRRALTGGEVSGETTTGVHRKLDIEVRLQELESLYTRVAELEERLDFTERMLAAKDEPARLEALR